MDYCLNMDDPQKHYANFLKKPGMKDHTWFSLYESPEKANL